MTWKTLTFLLLKLPLGLCCIITVILLVSALGITIICLTLACVTMPFFILMGVLQHVPEPGPRLRHYFLFALAGFGLNIAIFHLLNELASAKGQLARSLLGTGDTALRLQESHHR